MRRVVYVLGAGFSAPLGLPVMANFLEKAKDLYYEADTPPDHFKDVLDTLSQVHVANSYYATDVFNIEEILSILDMQDQVTGGSRSRSFTQFIKQVIGHYTPQLLDSPAPQRWSELLFWARPWEDYAVFISAALGYRFTRTNTFNSTTPDRAHYSADLETDRHTSYSFITLNYDLVLELIADHLRDRFTAGPRFSRRVGEAGVPLAKLHGSIDSEDIIPPTWGKTLAARAIHAQWQRAYQLLREANDIRIIGYSLPDTDAYVRYLLRAAVIETPNLKRIDVLCLDPSEQVSKRYRDFVTFRNWRFYNWPVEAYLGSITGVLEQWPQVTGSAAVERVHAQVFDR